MEERIVLESEESVDRWCRLLACSEMDLIRAVWTVGPRPADVDRFFWTIPSPDEAGEPDSLAGSEFEQSSDFLQELALHAS